MKQEPKVAPITLAEIQAQTSYAHRTIGGTRTTIYNCACCGKTLNQPNPANAVVMMNHITGDIVFYEPDADNSTYSVYDVGSDCAKKFLKGIAFRFDFDGQVVLV